MFRSHTRVPAGQTECYASRWIGTRKNTPIQSIPSFPLTWRVSVQTQKATRNGCSMRLGPCSGLSRNARHPRRAPPVPRNKTVNLSFGRSRSIRYPSKSVYTASTMWPNGSVPKDGGASRNPSERFAEGNRPLETRIEFAETTGEAVRHWFGLNKAQRISHISTGDNTALFDNLQDKDPRQDLGGISRFSLVAERDISRAFLTQIIRRASGWRWGYAAKSFFCSQCGKSIAMETKFCPACSDSEAVKTERAGWFVRKSK